MKNMKKQCPFFIWSVLLALLCPFPAFSASVADTPDEAAAAYERGDYAQALALWGAQAAKGDARAMHNLGVIYERGQGVPEDAALAVRWFRQAAEGGHVPAMSNYARMLEQGRGIKKDPAQAAHWFRQAADKGLAEAQYNLGVLYERGQGVRKSEREAAAWYSRAAAQQQADAQARLGRMYRDGRGVKRNATRAVLLLYGASMEGNAQAMKDLRAMAGKKASSPDAVLFGQNLARTDRTAMRAALAAGKVPAVREDAAHICDVYDVRKVVPGATEMAVCYGPGTPQPLGFVKIDYDAPDPEHAERIKTMVAGRFGAASASEGKTSSLWNMGDVIVATQYAPDVRQVGLMYMVPRVYHLTRKKTD